jgi:hypothetical protein
MRKKGVDNCHNQGVLCHSDLNLLSDQAGAHLLFCIYLFLPCTAKYLGGIKICSASAVIIMQHPFLTLIV